MLRGGFVSQFFGNILLPISAVFVITVARQATEMVYVFRLDRELFTCPGTPRRAGEKRYVACY